MFGKKEIDKITQLIKENNLSQALSSTDKYLLEESNNPNIYNLRGAILSKLKRHDDAIESFNKAIEIDKKFVPAYKNLIPILIEKQNFQDVIDNYEKLLVYDKENPKNYNDLAIYCDMIGDKDKAIQYIDKAIKLDDRSAQHHYNSAIILFTANDEKTFPKARLSFENCLKIEKDHALANYGIGLILKKEKNFKEAKNHFYITTKNKKDFHNGFYNLGLCCIALGQIEEAIKSFRESVAINPIFSAGYNSIGNGYMQLGKPKEAIEHYIKQTELLENSDNIQLKSQAIYNLALSYHQTSELDKAQELYLKALELTPKFADAQSQLAAIKLSKDLNDASINEEDLFPLDDIIEDSISEDSKINQIKNMIAKNNYKKAEDECLKVIKFDNKNAKYYALLSYALFGQHKLEEALDAVDKSIDLDTGILKNYSHKGMLLFKKERYKESIDALEHILSIDKDNPKALTQIGLSYKRMGESDTAKEYFEKALVVDPNYKNAQSALSGLINRTLDNQMMSLQESHKSLSLYSQSDSQEKDIVKISRLKHDVEQAEFLIQNNFNADPIVKFAEKGRNILSAFKDDNHTINIKNKELKNELINYWALPIIYNTKEVKHYLNPLNDWKAIQDQYMSSNPEFVVIDGILSEECLIELRKFCLYSKVFLREYENNYLGAFGNTGFISDIHLGIARDLKNNLPKIFGHLDLTHMWAFKYDSKLGSGINVHADFAKVNLNFWITPEDYNLDENSGGLKVYTTPPPKNWTFEKYNADQDQIYEFLNSVKAKHVSSHYKFNRAILFNSSLFHETEEINFKNIYEGRRVNVTYLFGHK